MSESSPDRDADATAHPPTGSPLRGGLSPTLEIVIVSRDDGPDRATVHPPGLTGIARMETWLSADRSAVVDLSAWR